VHRRAGPAQVRASHRLASKEKTREHANVHGSEE
jgi:hypothetical protein